jgi:hypothetical protein
LPFAKLRVEALFHEIDNLNDKWIAHCIEHLPQGPIAVKANSSFFIDGKNPLARWKTELFSRVCRRKSLPSPSLRSPIFRTASPLRYKHAST